MTYLPLPPIQNVEDILFRKQCDLVWLQQHCFRGKGKGERIQSLKNFFTRLFIRKFQANCVFDAGRGEKMLAHATLLAFKLYNVAQQQ